MAPMEPIPITPITESLRPMTTGNVMTPEFRVSFPYVFRPSKPMAGSQSDPKYTITALFAKGADIAPLKLAVKEAATEKWGADKTKWPKNLRDPFRDQGEKDFEGYEEGAVFITATSKQRPGLVDAKVQDIIEEKDFYPGCYARATVRAFAYDQAGNRGVAFGLQNVQKLRDGEPLGGRTRPSDDFQAVGDEGAKGGAGVFDE